MFGVPLERRFGTLFVAGCWLATVISGNTESTLFEGKKYDVAGASGGVFGLFGATCVHLVVEYNRLRAPLLRCLLVAFTVIQLASQFVNEPFISHASHVAGAINGAVIYSVYTRAKHRVLLTGLAAAFFVVALVVFYS